MPRQATTLIEYLTLNDLSRAEKDTLIEAVRYHDAELAEFDRRIAAGKSDLRIDWDDLSPTITVAEAGAQLALAEEEKRLRIEWKRGWLYFFFDAHPKEESQRTAKTIYAYDVSRLDDAQFLTKVPRKGGPQPAPERSQGVRPVRARA